MVSPQLSSSIFSIFFLLLLAGCLQNYRPANGGLTDRPDLPPPEKLTVPRWLPGYHWEYRTDDGKWRNKTVLAEQTYNGRLTYKVSEHFSPPDDFGLTDSTIWYDQESLGWVAMRDDVLQAEFSPPYESLFPFENRTAPFVVKANGGHQQEHTIEVEMLGWEFLHSPHGALAAIKLKMTEQHSNMTYYRWYSPEIMNLISYTSREGHYWLISWGTTIQ